jgi:arginine:agmatine antiporter
VFVAAADGLVKCEPPLLHRAVLENPGTMKSVTADRKLGAFLAMMLVISGMIGSGIYLLPASLGVIGSISILGWIAAVLGAAMLAGTFSWLTILRPGTAGLFSYILDTMGAGAGFVVASLYWVSCWVGNVAVALAVTGYLSVFVPAVSKAPGTTIATIAIIWLLVGINIVGPRFVAWTQSWLLAIGLAPIMLVAVGGWIYFHGHTFVASWNVTGQSFMHVVPQSVVIVFWAFTGIENAILVSPLVRNPARDVPIASLGGLAIASVIYVAACAAIMGILPASVLARSSAPFADAIVPVLGASGAAAIAMCAMLKASGTLAVGILVTVETADSESMLGQMSTSATARHTERESPAQLVFTGVLMSLVVAASASPTLARQFTIVIDLSVVLGTFAYVGACVALLRMSSSVPPRIRVWARALAIGSLLFCIALIAASEFDLLIWSAGAIVLAMLAYLPIRQRRLKALKTISRA